MKLNKLEGRKRETVQNIKLHMENASLLINLPLIACLFLQAPCIDFVQKSQALLHFFSCTFKKCLNGLAL